MKPPIDLTSLAPKDLPAEPTSAEMVEATRIL